MNKLDQKRGLIEIVAKSIKGSSFIGVRGYENKNGEVSNQTFQIGVNMEKAKQRDISIVEGLDVEEYAKNSDFDEVLIAQAKTKILASLQNPSAKRSDAQKDAYEILTNGVKRHKETGEIYVYGVSCRKTILTKGEYKEVNSRPLTLAQKEIKKALNLTTNKYRQFKVGLDTQIKMRGFDL
jgi:hypothetical protein